MHESSIFWLRVAAALYSVGLLHAILNRSPQTLTRLPRGPGHLHHRRAVPLRFPSWSWAGWWGHIPVNNFYESASLCAFLFAILFLFLNWRYQWSSSSVLLFPLVSLLTLVGSTELPIGSWSNPRVRDAWLLVHVLLILLGLHGVRADHTVASIFYLIQERRLKSKRPAVGLFDRLPPAWARWTI